MTLAPPPIWGDGQVVSPHPRKVAAGTRWAVSEALRPELNTQLVGPARGSRGPDPLYKSHLRSMWGLIKNPTGL